MVEVCEGECMGCSPGDEPLNLMRCHSYMKPLKEGSFLSFVSLLLQFISYHDACQTHGRGEGVMSNK